MPLSKFSHDLMMLLLWLIFSWDPSHLNKCGSFFHGIPLTLINVPSCDLENETVTFRYTAKFHHVKVLHEKFLLFLGGGWVGGDFR